MPAKWPDQPFDNRSGRPNLRQPSNLASVLQERRKNVSIHASSGVIWRIPAYTPLDAGPGAALLDGPGRCDQSAHQDRHRGEQEHQFRKHEWPDQRICHASRSQCNLFTRVKRGIKWHTMEKF